MAPEEYQEVIRILTECPEIAEILSLYQQLTLEGKKQFWTWLQSYFEFPYMNPPETPELQ